MPPNAKFMSVHITSSISDVCLQDVVGVAKNNENTNYNDMRFLFHFLKQMQICITANTVVLSTVNALSGARSGSPEPKQLENNTESMPPKKKSSSASADVCSICCQAISPKDESLHCAGRCQQRFHRYCASVPEDQYKALCEKSTPFLCPACYREQRDGEVNELKSTVEALRIELSQLRELVREVREKVEGQRHNRAASANVDCCS